MAKLGKDTKLPRRLNDPPAQEFDRIRTELLQIDNVVGCFIGPRRKGGRLLRSIGVVAIVDQKLAADKIPPNQMMDKHIRWSHRNGGAIRKISSDVQELSPYSAVLAFGSPILGPGDDVRTSDATIGVAAMHPQYGEVITTAGHAVYEGPPGTWEWAAGEYPIQVVPAGFSESIVAEVRRVVCNEWCDYALLKPQSPLSCLNLYRDRNPIWPPYHLVAAHRWALISELDGVAAGDNFSGADAPQKEVWDGQWVFGVAIDGQYLAKMLPSR